MPRIGIGPYLSFTGAHAGIGVGAIREREALLRLVRFRRLNSAQFEGFLFEGSSVAQASREVITRRVLRSLRKRGLIQANSRLVGGTGAGSARPVYQATEAGCRYLGRIDPALRGLRPPSREALSPEHALACADVALAFVRAARSHTGHAVSDWESERRAAELLGSSRVVPDGYIVYETSAWEIGAFVEVDLGTESPSRFARKVADYIAVLRSGSWRAQLPSWPLVLTVTPTVVRAKSLRRATENVVRREPDAERLAKVAEFDFAALPDVLARGPLAEIWQIASRDGFHTLISADGENAPAHKPDET